MSNNIQAIGQRSCGRHCIARRSATLRPLLSTVLAAGLLCASHSFAVPPALPGLQGSGDAVTSPADVAADIDFLLQAWRANALQLGAARLALDRSRDVRVRQFAGDLVEEHLAANLRFQRLAVQRGLGIPAAISTASPESEYGLEGLRGSAFDRRFVARAGTQAHHEAIALYRQEAEQGRDRALARFAADELPMLRRHLARAEALEAQFELQRRNASPAR